MAEPALAERLRAGETCYSGWCTLPDPLVAEIVARADFDCVALDMQHGYHDPDSILRGIGAIAFAGKPALVRVPLGDNAMAARALDMGAEAVLAPMINSAAEARAFVAATKYPPIGERSWGPARAMMLQGTSPQAYLESANRLSLALAMIETQAALDALDSILAVPGIDGVFVGPSDLSVALSKGERIAPLDPMLDVPLARVVESCRDSKKVAGVYAATVERALVLRHTGYQLIAIGGDQAYLASGARFFVQETHKK